MCPRELTQLIFIITFSDYIYNSDEHLVLPHVETEHIGYYMVLCSVIAMGTWKANNLPRLMMNV